MTPAKSATERRTAPLEPVDRPAAAARKSAAGVDGANGREGAQRVVVARVATTATRPGVTRKVVTKSVETKKAPAAKKAAPAVAKKKAAAKPAAKKAPAAKSTASKGAAKKAAVKPSSKAASKPAAKRPTPAATAKPATKKATVKAASKTASKASGPKGKVAVKASPKAAPKTSVPKTPKVKAKAAPKRPSIGPYAKDLKFLDEQRILLQAERTIYQGQAIDLKAEADSLAQEREPGDVQFDEESGEGGTVTVDRERDLALSAQALAAVEEIDDAMTRIEAKTYGACERCHQPIPKTRLRALPYARLCVACKSGGLSRR